MIRSRTLEPPADDFAAALGLSAGEDDREYRSASLRNALDAGACCFEATIGVPSLTERGISRSLGTNTSGTRPMIVDTSSSVIPTRESERLSTRATFSTS